MNTAALEALVYPQMATLKDRIRVGKYMKPTMLEKKREEEERAAK